MINEKLQLFCDRVLENGRVTDEDVHLLVETVLPDGPMNREEADTLIALDRAVPSAPAFGDYLVATVADFAVWVQRPGGVIDAEAARWLADSLSCGLGPTANGARVAFETVREAHRCDDALIAFALEANRRVRAAVPAMAPSQARAA
jgi:hypothetical protein